VDRSDETDEALDRRIAQRIRGRRIALGITQDQLAQSLGVSYQQIQKYETGANRISAVRLERIARRLAVPIGWFLAAEVEPSEVREIASVTPHGGSQRAALEVARNFAEVGQPGVRLALASLVRTIIERQA
jgi:transcriptional regulator with XRE-family HTH domain